MSMSGGKPSIDWQTRLRELCLEIPVEVTATAVTRLASGFLKQRPSPMVEVRCKRCKKTFQYPQFPQNQQRAYCDECRAEAKRREELNAAERYQQREELRELVEKQQIDVDPDNLSPETVKELLWQFRRRQERES